MRSSPRVLLVLLAACGGGKDQRPEPGQGSAVVAKPAAEAGTADPTKAPRLQGMGSFHWPISAKVPEVQIYFDQGMVLAYAFNHAEAARSFRHGASLDPTCAMCWWGAALVAGPNINAKMDPADGPKAWEAITKAKALASAVTKVEADYIAALSTRYSEAAVTDHAPHDAAYGDAICALATARPDDANALTLCAEARMDQHPWDYWEMNGKPKAWTPEILATLERAMTKDPEHPGANHLYVHALEASKTPGRATAAADRLVNLVPGAGHLVHMPAHIYIRTGRYHEATEANQRAVKVDETYVAQCREQGIYPLAYKPHNWHFMWASATLEGNSKLAIEAAKHLADTTPSDHISCHGGTLQHYKITLMLAYSRFGKWDELLALPVPDDGLPYGKAVWHYGQALAHAYKGDLSAADKELSSLEALVAAQQATLTSVKVWDVNDARSLMDVAVEVARGEIAARKKDYAKALVHLNKAVALEDALIYNEPKDWYYPVRQILGAIYLEMKKPKDAERVYREDLAEVPQNGYSLFGLQLALRAQGRTKDADAIEATFKEAWKHADFALTTSRF